MNGDFTKVMFAVHLNEAGKRLLRNFEHTSRQLKGTMEVRKLMRYETNAGRIRRGVPIFITFSPDEKHNVLMLRLHRSRQNDPIHTLDPTSRKYGSSWEQDGRHLTPGHVSSVERSSGINLWCEESLNETRPEYQRR